MNKKFYKNWKFWLGVIFILVIVTVTVVRFSFSDTFDNYQLIDSVLNFLGIIISAIMVVASILSEKKENRVQAIREMKISNYMTLISALTYRHNDINNYDYQQRFVEEINKANLYASKKVLNMLKDIKNGKSMPIEILIYEMRQDVHKNQFIEEVSQEDLKEMFFVAEKNRPYR